MHNTIRVQIGLLRETFPGERRVALTPDDVRRLAPRMTIRFEPGCGVASGHDDSAYLAAGAQSASFEDIRSRSDIILAVRQPDIDRAPPERAILIFLGSIEADDAGRSHPSRLNLSRLAGFPDAGSMDVSTTQAIICGHAAVLEAARRLGVSPSMLTIDGSFVRPIKMLALGADASCLQAIATARRLGAMTHAIAFSDDAQDRIEKLGAKLLLGGIGLSANPSPADMSALRRRITPQLIDKQLIVTGATLPGARPPILIDEETLSSLAPGTIVIDLTAADGGNCSVTEPDQVVDIHGVRVVGLTTLASLEAAEASRLFSEGIHALLGRIVDADGSLSLNRSDPIIRALTAAVGEAIRVAS
jgi:NAD(P) transhydrogenase subunit alpha